MGEAEPADEVPEPPEEDSPRLGEQAGAELFRQILDAAGRIGGSTVVVVLTAFGFTIGAVTLAAFSTGIGVPVTDLGLDVQGYVTVAGGALLFPLLAAVIVFGGGLVWSDFDESHGVDHPTLSSWLLVLVLAIWAVGVPLSALLVFGTAIWTWGWISGFAVLGAITLVVIGIILGSLALLGEGARDTETIALAVLALFVVSVILGGGSSFLWAKVIKDGDSPEYRGPLSIELVVPVERGRISNSGETACVDRVGTDVVIGRAATAVLTDWDWFLIDTGCERQVLISLLDD